MARSTEVQSCFGDWAGAGAAAPNARARRAAHLVTTGETCTKTS
jgi:hypothetical protein